MFRLFLGEIGVFPDDEGLDLLHSHQRLGKFLPHVLLPRGIVEGHIKLLEINAKAHEFVKAIVRPSRDGNRFYKRWELGIGSEYIVEDSGKLMRRTNDHRVI